MPIYEYQGQQYEMAEEDRAVAKQRILAYLEKQKAPAAPEGPIRAAEDAADFTRGVGNIIPQLQNVGSSAKALTGVVAKKLGFDKAGDEMIASGIAGMKESEAKMVVKDSDEFTEAWEKGIGTVITDWLPYQAGAGVGSLLETLGFMAVGAGAGAVGGAGVGAVPGAVGGAISKALIKQGIKEAAEKIVKEQGKEAAEKYIITEAKKAAVRMGSTAGMVGQAGLHGTGEVGGRAIEEAQERGLTPEDINLAKVLPAAAVHSVADFISNKIMLNALKPGDVAGKSLALDIAKRITTTGAKEMVPEEIQAIAERFGADLSLADAEAIKEYVNTAAASFGMSVVPGATGAVRTRFSSKLKETADAAKEESDKKSSAETLDKVATEENPVVDPTVVAKLQPRVGADGTPLAAASPATVKATEELNQVDATAPKDEVAAAPAATLAAPVQTATEYIASIDAGTPIKQGEYRKVAKELGLVIPVGTKNADGVQMIRDHLAKLGGTNVPVTNVDTTAGGAGAAIPGQQAGVPPGGVATTVAQGLGGAPAVTNVPAVGTTTQQSPLGSPEYNAVPFVDPDTNQNIALDFNNAFVDEDGDILIPGNGDTDYYLDYLLQSNNPVAIALKDSILSKLQQPVVTPTATSQVAAPPVATPSFAPSQVVNPTDATAPTQVVPRAPGVIPGFTTEDQLRQAAEKDIAEQEAAAEQNRLAFEESQRRAIPKTPQMPEIQEEYEGTRQEMEGAGLPPWEKLSATEKDVYLEGIRDNTIAEHREAGRKLAEYRKNVQETGAKGVKPTETRAINMYEENRNTLGRQLGIDFPTWTELSPESQKLYLDNVNTSAPIQQEVGFTRVAEQLEAEGQGIRGQSKSQIEALKLKGQEQEAQAKAVERTAREREAEAQAAGKGKPLSAEIIEALREGNINYALSLLVDQANGLKTVERVRGEKTKAPLIAQLADTRAKASKFIFQFIARRLNTIKLDSAVVMDQNNEVIQRLKREGKLAEYDPKTDTFYFTEQGLDEATLLHEAVHAGTVKIINTYLTNPAALTTEQREAMEHLEKIFEFSKKRLGGKFKNAYENLFEFVSYALTDNAFQIALSETQVRPLTKYSFAGSLWNHLTQVFSKIYGLFTPGPTKLEVTSDIYDQMLKDYGSMDLESAYETLEDATGDEVVELVEIIDGKEGPEAKKVQGRIEKGKKYEARVRQERFKRDRRFITSQAGFEGNLLMEVSEIFNRILETPQAGIEVAPLPAKAEGAKKEFEYREVGINEDAPEYDVKGDHQPKNVRYLGKLFLTAPGWRQIATKFQNSRYNIKHWQDTLDLAGKIIDDGRNKINNIYTQLTLSASSARNYYNQYVKDIDEKLEQAVVDFAKASNLDINKALNKLQRIAEALHDGERRHEKFLMIVPLNNDKILDGGKQSPADRRQEIYELLDSGVKLSESQKQQLKAEVEAIVKKYADPLGSSPRSSTKKDGTRVPLPIDEQNELYNVTGISPAARELRLKQFNELPADQKAAADTIFKNLQELHNATTELNKIGNYWSQPVSNRVGFYNFQHYIPLKGLVTDEDEMLNFDGERMGRELQDTDYAFEGRTTIADNPILQSRADATRAALRAGRKDLTQSIKNSLKKEDKKNPEGQGLLHGYVKESLTFADRRNSDKVKALRGESTIFHYNEDGSIDVLVVQDKELREAIRRTYKDTNPIIDMANKATSFLGALHTRYNYNFAPMNFVRDALTNAFTMSAEMGPKEAAAYIKAIAGRTLQGGMTKAIDISVAYERGDMAALQRMKKSDPIAADMIEYIERGGMVSYLQGLSMKSNFQSLQKELGRSGMVRKKEQFDKIIDVWTDMFELSSRSAAYAITKRNEMSKGKSEEAATIRAVAYAKNLANFEQVGDWGKAMGAFYMFFRPAATGAVRAIESAIPAFRTLEQAVQGLPQNIKDDPQALKTFTANYAARQRNARITLAASMGLGIMMYTMAQMMADDDDLGRNKVEADNMQQWTRFARLHLPKSLTGSDDFIVQIPWGFGLGAFAAAGAQLAGATSGKGSMGDAMWNIATQISLDSFVPIPVSRMDATEDPWAFVLDSFMPSTMRPILEFVINKNGLGQDIYSDKNRRMGDAYTGGDRIPEIYRDLARVLADSTNGGIDWSPNTIYFLANSYLDGISKVGELGYGTLDMMRGNKSFEAKTDLPLVGSFIGAKSNFDSREFTKVENQIKEMERRLNMFASNPEQYGKYIASNPFAEILVEQYNENINGRLKDIRADLNEYRKMKLPSKDRKEIINALTLEQNIIKRQMIEEFKALGVHP